MKTASISPAARRDLDDYVLWLRTEIDVETASRFAVAAEISFQKLAENPNIAPTTWTRNVRLMNVRKGKVAAFPKMLIFFEPTDDGIKVLRVLHAAADWWAILGID